MVVMLNRIEKSLFYLSVIIVLMILQLLSAQPMYANTGERRILLNEYRDKMIAGWIGQMVGVGWGAPTEFQYMGQIIPIDQVPEWHPEMINQFYQDDLYVEMTFLRTLDLHGFDVSSKQAGINFANSRYMLWHANEAGRDNLRKGIAPPNSGHPFFNSHSDDIDYQIEADYSGLIAPGLPNVVIELGEKFGRLMNYGDGLYGGQFIGGMYAEAFFENEPIKLIEAGLNCIPKESQYAKAIRDVIKWHTENPNDWEATWELINNKYHKNQEYRRFSCAVYNWPEFNIDAKINGAYIAMGLLYGNSNLDDTIIISMRCGQDSDCNPSNAAGVLFTTRGFKNLPDRFKSSIDVFTNFSYTEYSYPKLIELCEKLAVDAIKRAGGRVEENANGEKEFVIPIKSIEPSKLEHSWNPSPISEIEFTKSELAQINGYLPYKYSLEQNYPNPFNPTTTISYILTKENDVSITIYDILGKELVQLYRKDQSVGYHSIIWNGTDHEGYPVTAGVYLYRLKVGDFAQTKKMVLVK